MHPLANPSHALLMFVHLKLAELATKPSFAATTSPFQSACSATPPSHILTFSNSVSPRPSSPALSHDTNKTFYSLKNLPCFPLHKPPSPMTDSSATLIYNYATYTHKSSNSTRSSTIYSLPKINSYDKLIARNITHLIHLIHLIHLNLSSFIAAPIHYATASCLPLGSVPHVTSTPVRTAANSRPRTTILFMFAIPILSLPSPL